jgi:dipeptidyl aminopeptidase/acylaminoacyl peptidase
VFEDWYEGEYDNLDNDISTYMHPDFFLPLDLQNDEFKKLQPYLIANSVSDGWRPKAPIYLCHAKVDTHVPYENAEATVSKFRKAGANVSFVTYAGNHLSVGVTFVLRLLIQFSS